MDVGNKIESNWLNSRPVLFTNRLYPSVMPARFVDLTI